jgi:hypothetical protein
MCPLAMPGTIVPTSFGKLPTIANLDFLDPHGFTVERANGSGRSVRSIPRACLTHTAG